MRFIKESNLKKDAGNHPDSLEDINAFLRIVKLANWKNFNELKEDFPKTEYITNDRYKFKIKKNKYRLIVIIRFKANMMFYRFFGTHADYDKIKDHTKL